jgi:hypothetical protein
MVVLAGAALLILLQQQMEQVAQETRRLLLRHRATMVASALPAHLTMVVVVEAGLALPVQMERAPPVEMAATELHPLFLAHL